MGGGVGVGVGVGVGLAPAWAQHAPHAVEEGRQRGGGQVVQALVEGDEIAAARGDAAEQALGQSAWLGLGVGV